jgi:hypothetical protein
LSSFGHWSAWIADPGVVKMANLRPFTLGNFTKPDHLLLKNNDFLHLARPVHWYWHEPDGGLEPKSTRGLKMFNSFASARETATMFAGAFISALLLVSAATSLPLA